MQDRKLEKLIYKKNVTECKGGILAKKIANIFI